MRAMRAGVIDVGSNTIRLLVADVDLDGIDVVAESKVWAGLGADVAETGWITKEKLAIAADAAAEFATNGRRLGCDAFEVLVASPGRQAGNAEDLVCALQRSSRVVVRVLTREEEARLGYYGAMTAIGPLEGSVVVCDVGGGSTQLALGASGGWPSWLRSFDIGSLRLTAELLYDDPPQKKAIAHARARVGRELDGAVRPLPDHAVAIGGSARAVRRLSGDLLGEQELRRAVSTIRKASPATLVRTLGVPRKRAETLLAGAIILAEVQRRLAVPFRVAPGGLRQGAVLELASRSAAA
jgi:exopolyphosphatase/guanosine-5'-triphosphate,3'-diphosphate pyrophosphatase